MKKQQAGFTLIELVAVIVLLGILAVTALPRFVNLQADAREATVQGFVGALNGAMTQVYAKSLIDGTETTATGDTVTVNGVDIELIYGYPDAAASIGTIGTDDIQGIVDLDSSGDVTWSVDGDGGTILVSSTAVYLGYSSTCAAIYTQATSATAAAAVTTDVSSC